MRFTQDANPNVNVIRGYGPGELRINDEVYRTTMIVASTATRAVPSITNAAELDAAHAALLLELQPEVVLIRHGAAASVSRRRLRRPIPQGRHRLRGHGYGRCVSDVQRARERTAAGGRIAHFVNSACIV